MFCPFVFMHTKEATMAITPVAIQFARGAMEAFRMVQETRKIGNSSDSPSVFSVAGVYPRGGASTQGGRSGGQDGRDLTPLTTRAMIEGGALTDQNRIHGLDFRGWSPTPKAGARRILSPSVNGGAFPGIAGRSRTATQARAFSGLRIEQEIRDNIGKTRSRYAEERAYEHGMDRENPRPAQEFSVRDRDGNVILKGEATSVADLIAKKSEEARKKGEAPVSLANADLRNVEFKGTDLGFVDMRGANLAGAKFLGCKMNRVDMSGADMRNTLIDGCEMDDVRMTGFVGNEKTKFSNSSMNLVAMNGAFAPGVKMENIAAEKLDIAGSDFRNAVMTNIYAKDLWAEQVNLNGAHIGMMAVEGEHSSFRNAQMMKAELTQVSFGTQKQGINMEGLNAAGATLYAVNFNSSNISGMSLEYATMKADVDMKDAITRDNPVKLEGTDVTGLETGPKMAIQADTIKNDKGQEINVHAATQVNQLAPELVSDALPPVLRNKQSIPGNGGMFT